MYVETQEVVPAPAVTVQSPTEADGVAAAPVNVQTEADKEGIDEAVTAVM